MSSRSIQLRGVLAGRLWWPVGAPVCTAVSCTIVRSDSDDFPTGGPFPDLRTALLALSYDGNLSSAGFLSESLYLEVTRTRKDGTSRTRCWRIRGRCWETDDVFADEALASEID